MGNQVAIRLHTQPGQEVVCEARAHVLDWEMGMAAVFSGCTLRPVAAERGILTWELVRGAIYRDMKFHASTGLICIENTHMAAGGTVMPVETAREICDGRARAGAAGASGWGAGVQRGGGAGREGAGIDARVRHGDVLLSKGLGAPVGSMLVGRRRIWRGRGCIASRWAAGCGRRACWRRRG